jgi:hypothetical protein
MGQKWSKDVKRFNTEICKNDAWFFSKFELVKFVRDAPNFEQLWKTGQPSRHMLTVAGPRNPLLNSTQGESGGWMFITSIHMYIYIMSHFNAFHRFWSIHGPRLVESSPLVMMSK